MVIFDDTSTSFTLNDNMMPRQNSKLYFMTTKALGHSLAQKFISQANQNSSNGRELWQTLDARYLNKEQASYLLQDGLRIAYDELRMNDNETMFDFSHRYDVAYGKLVQNNMDTLTGAWLTLHFIKALNKPSVFASLKTKLHLPTYDKYITTNIKQLGRELETYHDIHVQAYGTSTPTAPQPAVPPTATPRVPTTSTPAPAAQPPAAQPQPSIAPPPPTPVTRRHPDVTQRVDTFKSQLSTSDNPTQLIINKHNECYNTTKCLFHTIHSNHTFIQCIVLKAICREVGKTTAFHEAKDRIAAITNTTPPSS